jgi:hypothetical protein
MIKWLLSLIFPSKQAVEPPISPVVERKVPQMIKMSELNPKGYALTEEQAKNLAVLHERINKVRDVYGKPMIVNSGLRSMEQHLKIYKDKGITDPAKIPMKSRHLIGAAVDIADPDGKLMDWVEANVKLMEELGLWMEVRDNVGRVHFQIFSPASGKRFFNP